MTDKQPLPDNLRALALKAKAKVQKLGTSAPLDVIAPKQNDFLVSPYADADWELWVCLLLETFGTRNITVVHGFMRQLARMIPTTWDEEQRRHVHDYGAFEVALAIICSLKPSDEAQAAIAIHCVALHLATYKVTDHMASRSWLDPKTGSALAAITKAYAAQVQALKSIQRPRRVSRQTITVNKSVTVNYRDEKHVHLPEEPVAIDAGATVCPTMPGSNKTGKVLRLAGGQG